MNDELQKLLDEANDVNISELTEDQLKTINNKWHKLRRKTNPLSSNIDVHSGKNEQLLFMFVPMYRDYITKFMVTAIIGYMNRACDEWGVPDGVPVIPVYDYIDNPSLIDPPQPVNDNTEVDAELLNDYKNNRKQMEKRVIIKEFIEYIFQYDPDEHIRSAYSPNSNDPERKLVITKASRMAVYMENRRIKRKKKLDKKEAKEEEKKFDDFNKVAENNDIKTAEKEKKLYVKDVVQKIKSRSKKGGFKLVKRKIKCTKIEYDEYIRKKEFTQLKREKKLLTHDDDFIKEPEMVKLKRMKDITLNDTVREMIPSADLFYKLLYYTESNYEELLTVVNDLYSEKPDLDWAINPLKMVKNNEEARQFRRHHAQEISFPVTSVLKGIWSIFGPYKKNRDRLDFYGSNMPLFEEMFKMREKDSELGAQLMMKRKKKKKKKQDKRVGPLNKNIKLSSNPVTNIDEYPSTIDDDTDNDFDDDEKKVIVEVIRMKKGGLETEKTEFITEYDTEATIIKRS